jgi:hypothetical protein
MLAVDPGYVVAGVIMVHHGVPHVRNRLFVTLVFDVIDQREGHVFHEDEGDQDDSVRDQQLFG